MRNNNIGNDNNYIFVFYSAPFLSTNGFTSLLFGGTRLGPYKGSDIQVRIVGLITLIFCIYITHILLIKWPKIIGGKQNVKEVWKIFLSSWFLFFWVQSFMIYLCYEIYHIAVLKVLYFISIGVCVYFQHKFIERLKKLLKYDSTEE